MWAMMCSFRVYKVFDIDILHIVGHLNFFGI
jgi:hypothetical protein